MDIRPMRHGDVEAVAVLERNSPSPWLVAAVAAELDRPEALQLVAVDDAAVVGWCCGRYAAPEAELLKIAVAPAQRRCGIGASLLRQWEDHCRSRGCDISLLEVRADNTAAIALYRKQGYAAIGRRKNYYDTPRDDALILRKSLLCNTSNLPFSGDLNYENSSGS